MMRMKNSIHLRLIAVLAIAVLLTSCGAAMKATPAESAGASSPASVTLTYQTDTGEVEGPTIQVDPGGRESVNVGDTVTTYDVSTRVASDNPVIAERAVYYNNRACAHSSIGVTEPADTWYLAEGATYGGFETWVLVANPGDETAQVTLTYQTDTGEVEGPTIQVDPGGRESVNVGDTVTTYDVST
ncbi:MAG: hypothetical protein KJ602_01785, partial [Actinobacteria bacterium]|nr:hypothetical protein [Actinomycetota bacterium]